MANEPTQGRRANYKVLPIRAIPESEKNARLVAVRNKGDDEWTLIETSREGHEASD